MQPGDGEPGDRAVLPAIRESNDCRQSAGAIGVLCCDVHADVMRRASLDRYGGLAEALVESAFTIRKMGGAGQAGAVFAVRAFTIVGDVEAGEHCNAVLTANGDDVLHQRADLLVVNFFFVHGDALGLISRLALSPRPASEIEVIQAPIVLWATRFPALACAPLGYLNPAHCMRQLLPSCAAEGDGCRVV